MQHFRYLLKYVSGSNIKNSFSNTLYILHLYNIVKFFNMFYKIAKYKKIDFYKSITS